MNVQIDPHKATALASHFYICSPSGVNRQKHNGRSDQTTNIQKKSGRHNGDRPSPESDATGPHRLDEVRSRPRTVGDVPVGERHSGSQTTIGDPQVGKLSGTVTLHTLLAVNGE